MNALITLPRQALEGEIVGNGLFIEENPFRTGSFRWVQVPEGARLSAYAEAAAKALPNGYGAFIDLWIEEDRIERKLWHLVTPKPGRTVYARVRPEGGKGGKNVLRAFLMIALVVVATVLLGPGGPLGAAGIGGAIGLSGSLAAAFTAATIAVVTTVGMLAINALIPAPGLTNTGPVNKPRITGSSNNFAPYYAIPRVFGKIRLYPVLAGHPYTEMVGKKQYLRMLLLVGWGPLRISDLRIGNTLLSAYKNTEFEIIEGGPPGWAGNVPLTLYNRTVQEFSIGAELLCNVASTYQTTGVNVIEISVDIAFPFGLVKIHQKGDRANRAVGIYVEYRATGGSSWTNAPLETAYADSNQTISGNLVTISSASTDAAFGNARFKVPAGQYDVRLVRQTADAVNGTSGDQYIDRSFWQIFRYFTADAPVVQDRVCLIAIRLQASDQLNGVPSQISCLAEAYLPVFSAGVWTYTITRNPAWAFCDVLRTRGKDTIIADARIDVAGSILTWAAACDTTASNASEPKWTYDGVIEGGSVFDALREVAAAGRAAYTMRDGLFGVVQDKTQATPVQVITPRNSWGYSGSRSYLKQPHAYRVEFQNAAKDYVKDERIVYADGYTSANASIFEVLPMPGCTSATQAWREGRYHMAVANLRQEEHRVKMDIEGLRCTMGDRVELAYDAMVVGQCWGRVTSLLTSGANTIGFVLDNETVFVGGKTYQLRTRHADGSTIIRTVTQGANANTVNCSAEATAGGASAGDLFVFGETGIVTAPMIVKKIEPENDLAVQLTMANYDEGIYTAETGTIPAFSSYIATDVARQPPTDPTVTVRGDGTVHEAITDHWVLQKLGVDIYNPSGLIGVMGNEVQFRELYSLDWKSAGFYAIGAQTIYCTPVIQGHTYQVRARSKGTNGLYSNWVQPSDVVVIGSAVLPSAPTSPSVIAFYRANGVNWINPPELDLEYVEVLASQTNNSATAVVVGRSIAQSFTHQNLTGGSTWYYWLRGVNFTGGVSALTTVGPSTASSIITWEGIGADNVLAIVEKQEIIREFTQLTNEKSGLDTQATALGITAEATAYDTAYSTLNTYLTGLSPAYNDTSQNTAITRTTWNSNWAGVYGARQTLLNKIDTVASTQAQWPNITDPTGTMPDPNATGGDTYVPDSSFDSGTGTGFGPNWAADSRFQRADLP